MYTVYVLYSEKFDRIYIGCSSNLIERYKSHQFLATKGYTIRYRPWKVVHLEYFETKEEAMQRERALKSGQGRLWIKNEILSLMRSVGFISA